MEVVKEGCPFCDSDVAGDDEHGFYCKECNLIYSRRNLEMKPVAPEKE